MSLLGRKTFCLITGASRGIGKTIAAELSKKLAAESLVVLVARNQQGLEDTVARLKESCPNVTVVPVSIDLSQCDFNSLNLSELIQGQSFDLSMLIHNAGTISDPSKKASEISSVPYIRAYMDTNFTSFVALNTLFLQQLAEAKLASQITVVNISSLCAVKGMASFSLYSAAKAARDSFLRVLACENPEIRVLNYAPGPIKTDMLKDLSENSWDPKMKSYFKESINKAGQTGGCLTCEQTVERLLHILDKNIFENGAHIDYYDKL